LNFVQSHPEVCNYNWFLFPSISVFIVYNAGVSLSQLGQNQGCQMVCFQTKNPNLGKFWRALDWQMFIYFMAIWYMLWIFGIFYDHLVYFVFIWHIFPFFGIKYQEKSGNPGQNGCP
jgi:hypothetical protein